MNWDHAREYERGALGREMYEVQQALAELAAINPNAPEVIAVQASFDQADAHLRYGLEQAIAPYLAEIRDGQAE